MRGKKGVGALGAVVIFLGVFIGIFILCNHIALFNQNFIKDCSDNLQCQENQYCGADFTCHEVPIREQNIVQEYNTYSFIGPALILSIAIVLAAIILKKRESKKEIQNNHHYNHERNNYDWSTYYAAQAQNAQQWQEQQQSQTEQKVQ